MAIEMSRPAVSTGDASADLEAELARVSAERDLYRDKLQQVAEAIGSKEPLRIVHDVRNVLNELALLRKLVELEND